MAWSRERTFCISTLWGSWRCRAAATFFTTCGRRQSSRVSLWRRRRIVCTFRFTGRRFLCLFAPFARLSYGWALTAWLAVNVLIYAFCCYAVWKTCPSLQTDRWTVLILAMAFPGFFHLLAWGQTSGLALLCFTLAYLALRSDRTLLAGLAIGSLIFKPQLGLAAAVVFVFARQWKVVAGAVMAACLELATAWMHYGTDVMTHLLACSDACARCLAAA